MFVLVVAEAVCGREEAEPGEKDPCEARSAARCEDPGGGDDGDRMSRRGAGPGPADRGVHCSDDSLVHVARRRDCGVIGPAV